MPYLLLIFASLLGLVVGSFLNVVALRYNSGRTLGGRSQCFSCSMQLKWLDMVPVFSFVVLRGRCRGCSSRLDWQYPVVELVTGLIFVLIFLKISSFGQPVSSISVSSILYMVSGISDGLVGLFVTTAFYWVIFCILIVISVYDLKHKIIPDGLVYMFALLALGKIVLMLIIQGGDFSHVLWSILAGPALALPFVAIWYFSAGRAMGFGDAKLALGIGWLLGLSAGFSAIVLSFWLGAAYGIALIVHRRVLSRYAGRVTMKSEIPFGPFMVVATFVTFVWEFNLLSMLGGI